MCFDRLLYGVYGSWHYARRRCILHIIGTGAHALTQHGEQSYCNGVSFRLLFAFGMARKATSLNLHGSYDRPRRIIFSSRLGHPDAPEHHGLEPTSKK